MYEVAVAGASSDPTGRPRWATLVIAFTLFGTGCSLPLRAAPPSVEVETILADIAVSNSQQLAQQTPIANRAGAVYIATIEPGNRGDEDGVRLHTVVYKGTPESAAGENEWRWDRTILENRTAFDPWHTPPGIGVDRDGFVHVAYNMHNLPWQYKMSRRPADISEFVFRGQSITLAEIERYKFENKTSFKSLGDADIPGNQITYPAFFNDREQNLYVTYRFAAKPALTFSNRTMSSAVARYDSTTHVWRPLGAPLDVRPGDAVRTRNTRGTVPRAIASATGWTSYNPRLMFGPGNEILINWYWREGIAGSKLVRPCVIRSRDQQRFETLDGAPVQMPAGPENCSNMGIPDTDEFYSIGSVASDSHGSPRILTSPVGESRQIYRWNGEQWASELSPGSATEIFFDAADNLWALSHGLAAYVQRPGSRDWITVRKADERLGCRPRASLDERRQVAYVYTQSCEGASVSVHRLKLDLG